MRKTILAATCAALFGASFGAAAANTRLTVYSGDFDAVVQSVPMPGMPGFALVRQEVSLPSQDGEVALAGLPVAIDAAGARIVPPPGVRVTGQRYDLGATSQAELLARAIGQSVTVEYSSGGEPRAALGTLLAVNDGLVIDRGGETVVLRQYDSVALTTGPQGIATAPMLRWNVAGAAGSADYIVEYPTGGLAWRAEYVAMVESSCRMDFSGAAQVVNRSGAGFDDAQLTLVAGQPRRQPVAGAPQPMMFKAEMRVAEDAAPSPQASGEYHAYPLPGRVDLPNGSVQRVPLLDEARGVPCTRRYVARSPMGYFRPSAPIIEPNFGPEGEVPVLATLEFANTKAMKLGVPLPAGRLRVFTGEDFLGEAALAHTPAGREVKADLGQAFDLTLVRTRKDLQLDADRLGLVERIELVLRNAKPEAATVRVEEALPRWTDWEIVDASAEWAKQDAQTAVFDVRVPAQGEATVAYAVRYRWPESMRQP